MRQIEPDVTIRWSEGDIVCFDCPCGAKEVIAHADHWNFSGDAADYDLCDCGRKYTVQPVKLLELVADREPSVRGFKARSAQREVS